MRAAHQKSLAQMTTVFTKSAFAPLGPYSQAIRFGDLIFCSGQLGIDPQTNILVNNSIESETKVALANLKAVIVAAGSSLPQVVKTTLYLTNLDDFAVVNQIYADFFGAHKPARATVEVSKLPKNARIEIEAIAQT